MSTADQLKQYKLEPTWGCHVWTGKLGSNGRPIVWAGRTPMNAYKLAWQEKNGPVPVQRVLDHVCRVLLCVRPDHLEPVTKSENELRKRFAYRMRRTTCPRGHELKLSRIITPGGGWVCRTCNC